MKHIQKRFFLEEDEKSLLQRSDKFEILKIDKDFDNQMLNNRKQTLVFTVTDTGKSVGGFVQKIEGRNYVVPIPDPTLVYFNNAQGYVAKIIEMKKKLLTKLDFSQELSESAINEIYHFYGLTSGFVIFLFTSIESFINQIVPDDFTFTKKLTKRTELYNKLQIHELDFTTKITEVLSQAKGKSFFTQSTPSNGRIWNLKDFRNEIIHTKPDESPLKYEKLIKKSLNFGYGETLDAVAKFMNFYKEDYILECKCGLPH